jgi:thiol:disulfide interchange protein DsbD
LIGLALGYLRVAFCGFARLQLALGTYWIALIIAVVAGLALGAVHLSFGKSAVQSLRKAAGITLVSVGAFGLLGVFPSPVNWQLDADKAIATAKSSQKPVFIDFGAEWCTACKELEHEFSSRDFVTEIDRFVPVRIDGTHYDAQFTRYCDRYQVDGLPVMIVLNSRGEVAHVFRSRVPINDIVNVLRDVH